MTYLRPLQWISMATAVICTLWFYPATLDPFNIPKLAVLVVGAAMLIGWLAGHVKGWWSASERALVGAVGAFVLGLTAAALASDQNVYRTLWGAWARNDGWLAYVSLAVVTLSVALAFRGSAVSIGMLTLIGVGFCEVLYGVVQTTGNDPVAWNSGYNAIIGTVGNPNFASALLGVSAVAMCWMVLETNFSTVLRALAGLTALVAVWLTLRSESIQGTLAFGAGLALLLGGWLSMAERAESLRKLLWPYVGVGVFSTVVGVLGLTGSGPLSSILYSQNLINRTYYWRAGWRMFLQEPLFGIGLDSFGDWYRILRLPEQVAATGAGVTSNAAHSVVFQMLATGGIALFGTFLLLQMFVVWRAIVAFRSGENRLLVSGVTGAWLAFLLQSLFSIDQLGLTVWGWVIGGLVIGVSYSPAAVAKSRAGNRRAAQQAATSGVMPAAVAACILGLVAIMLVAGPLSTDSRIRTLMSYSVDSTQPAQVSATAAAIVADAEGAQDPYWLATAIGKLYSFGALTEGQKLAEASARKFPLDLTLWQLAATAYEQTGRAALATPWRARTVELDPLNTEYADLLAADKAAK